jgi:ABC-type multidrug transport system fused ATPase/permease subunit
MPALQGIYSSITDLTFVGPSLDKIYNAIKDRSFSTLSHEQGFLSLNKSISLNNISYTYPNTSIPTLKNINLSISAKTTVGFVGATGSGKTTTIDIILGLLEPQKGTLEVDGKIITRQNVKSWQRSIGYVPQHIYLSDDTISSNIAFGVPSKDINFRSVKKVAKIAQLDEFVTKELPQKYQTNIGERGIRLSGGQRQRIGIARALYHNPQVLILDEATSALDNQTEAAVMDALNNLNKDITIIIIAHRLNTVKNCDIIFKLNKGQVIGSGSFDKLMNSD